MDGLEKKEQETCVFRLQLNERKGYVVYKLKSPDANSACPFHYHWNYTLDLPLSAL